METLYDCISRLTKLLIEQPLLRKLEANSTVDNKKYKVTAYKVVLTIRIDIKEVN